MTLRERADKVAQAVFASLGELPSDESAKHATDIIEHAIIDVVLSERQRCANAVVGSGTPDADRAHKLAEEIRRAEDAAIAARAADTR